MGQRKRWKVVLDAETAPACGDWVAISGMGPADEEVARVLSLNGMETEGFTILQEPSSPWQRGPSLQELWDAKAAGLALWMRVPNCVEVMSVERLDFVAADASWQRKMREGDLGG